MNDEQEKLWMSLNWKEKQDYYYSEMEKHESKFDEDDEFPHPYLEVWFWRIRQIQLLLDSFGQHHPGCVPNITWVDETIGRGVGPTETLQGVD